MTLAKTSKKRSFCLALLKDGINRPESKRAEQRQETSLQVGRWIDRAGLWIDRQRKRRKAKTLTWWSTVFCWFCVAEAGPKRHWALPSTWLEVKTIQMLEDPMVNELKQQLKAKYVGRKNGRRQSATTTAVSTHTRRLKNYIASKIDMHKVLVHRLVNKKTCFTMFYPVPCRSKIWGFAPWQVIRDWLPTVVDWEQALG